MRRFLFFLLLLTLTLLIGRELQAAPPTGGGELRFQSGFDFEFDDDDYEWRRRRTRTYPRNRGDDVVFRLPDRDYESVAIAGDFSDWEPVPMRFVERRDYWEASVELDRGGHRYHYIVMDENGRSRDRRDPANPRRARYDDRWVSEVVIGKNHRVLRPHEEFDFDIFDEVYASFQRVDGFSLGFGPRFRCELPWSPSLDGRLLYGFSSEEWSGAIRLRQPLLETDELAIVVEAYDQTDYTEQTGLSDTENSLAAWIFREDGRDYYRREGIALGLVAEPSEEIELRFEMLVDDYESQEVVTHAGWNLGRPNFQPNPAVLEGTMRSLVGEALVGDDFHHFWLRYETSDDDMLSTTTDFAQLTAQYRSRLRLGRYQRLDFRVKAGGTLSGSLPQQRRYVVGGIGTVRGYGYQSLLIPDPDRDPATPLPVGGEQMALVNAEYGIGVESDLMLVLLFDSGMAWEDRSASMDLSELESSIGVGIVFDEDYSDSALRFDLVKPLAAGSGDFMVQARLSRPF